MVVGVESNLNCATSCPWPLYKSSSMGYYKSSSLSASMVVVVVVVRWRSLSRDNVCSVPDFNIYIYIGIYVIDIISI